MHTKLARRPLVIAAVAVTVASAAAGAGVATAAIPDATQTYTACLLNNVGTLRLIDPSLGAHNPMGHCFVWESTVTWNQKGQIRGSRTGRPNRGNRTARPDRVYRGYRSDRPGRTARTSRTARCRRHGHVRHRPSADLQAPDTLVQVGVEQLDAGSYSIVATANIDAFGKFAGGDAIWDSECELHSGTGIIGGATDRRVIPTLDSVKISLSANGGAQIAAGGGASACGADHRAEGR